MATREIESKDFVGIPEVRLMDVAVLGVPGLPGGYPLIVLAETEVGLGGVEIGREGVAHVVRGVRYSQCLVEVVETPADSLPLDAIFNHPLLLVARVVLFKQERGIEFPHELEVGGEADREQGHPRDGGEGGYHSVLNTESLHGLGAWGSAGLRRDALEALEDCPPLGVVKDEECGLGRDHPLLS